MIKDTSNPAFSSRSNTVLKHCTTLAALALVVAVLWGIIFDRWRPSDWGTPVDYSSDALFYMGMMKHAHSGDLQSFGYIHSNKAGAPFKGSLNDFPLAERPLLWFGGLLSRIVGLHVATNILVISAHILAALSFYFAARLWRVAKPFAFFLSLPYAFIPYGLIVSNSQLPLLFYGLFPLQLYCTLYIAKAPILSWRENRFKLSVLVAFLSSLFQVYLTLPFLLLSIFALVSRLINRKSNIILSTTPFFIACLTSTIILISYIFYWTQHGPPYAMFRQYSHLEIGGLKLIDLFLPGQYHAFGLFDGIYQRYLEEGAYTSSEAFRVYLGVIATFGLLVLSVRFFERTVSGSPIPVPALIALFFIAYSSFGGLNALSSLLSGFYLIRTTTRYAYVIAAIGLIYCALALSRWTSKWHVGLRITLSLSLSLIGLVDQARPSFLRHRNSANSMKERLRADRDLANKLESELPEKSMIFMLPYMPFPEAIPIHRLTDYELIRPFLYSKNLHYSYGSHKGRPEADWQANLIQKPSEQIVSELERYGFSGILVNRLAYPDAANTLIEEFVNAGRAPSFTQKDEWVFIPLKPVSNPELPSLSFVFSDQWLPFEGSNQHWWRWSGKIDGSKIDIHTKKEGPFELNFNLRSVSPRKIDITLNDNLVHTVNFDYGTHIPLSIIVDLKSGKNTLKFSSKQPPILPSPAFSATKIAFAVEDLHIEAFKGYSLSFSEDWYPAEGAPPSQWHWTGKVTGSKITVYSEKSGSYNLAAFIATISKRNVYISLNGHVINTLAFPRPEERHIAIPIELKKGENILTLSSDEAPVRPGTSDMRLLAFYIKEWEIRPVE